MGRYLFLRSMQGFAALIILGTIVFIAARITGSPVDLLLPPEASREEREALTHRLGLDRPYHEQYLTFVGLALKGDLGNSVRLNKPVTELYLTRFPNTFKLAAAALVFSVVVALPLGVLAGTHRGDLVDQSTMAMAVVGTATPHFWQGLLLIQVFAVWLGVLPAAGTAELKHYVLPVITMTSFPIAGTVRLLRSSMIETLDSEYAKLARIKGLSNRMVIWKHCLRNALIPVLGFAGIQVGALVGGSIIVETVFAWPGVGRLAAEAVRSRDYPVIQGVVLINGALIILINLSVDVISSYVDPRIKSG